MSDAALRAELQEALKQLEAAPFLPGVARLFDLLGYHSDRRLELDDPSAATFLDAFDPSGRIDRTRARIDQWRSIEMLFQLSGAELRSAGQLSLLDERSFAAQLYQSFLFFAVELDDLHYTRTQLAEITREINKLFQMPVSVAFRYQGQLTLSIVTHRPHKRDSQRDVLEKVALIYNVRLAEPHRGHIEVLADLALPQLATTRTLAGFDDLQLAWARTLDITELNRRFYKEIADWYFWAVSQVTFPEGAGATAELRNATSVIRLLTRLIFVWFLREKGLVPSTLFRYRDVEQLLVSLQPGESTFYKAILQNLFFATLNTEMHEPPRRFRGRNSSGGRDSHHGIPSVLRYEALFRDPEAALRLFADVPFLNGGLFECLDPETGRTPQTLVDGFSDHPSNPLHMPNELFFNAQSRSVDLNPIYGTRGRQYRVRGLIDILNSYKFTVAENTPVEEEIALDPELLGQVFENLLAAYNPETETTARKQTGSFYTPRGVVEYMVDESLVLHFADALARAGTPRSPAVEQQLRELLAYNTLPNPFDSSQTRTLIAAIDTLKVLDPACGSGAFPMGVLQKLVYVLSKLDPGNQEWQERQRTRAGEIEDSVARAAALQSIAEAFQHNEHYGRKLFLIENCLYGVDIQPIAVQIAKLRCFIALIVDQRIDDGRPNRGVRSLPNLETKFVVADALLSIERTPQLSFLDDQISDLEAQLHRVRSRHFSARTPKTKQEYREKDAQLRSQLARVLTQAMPIESAELLARWDPYAQNEQAQFFDPEWMFSLTTGFDIVIANPPYVRQEQIKHRKKDLERLYSSYTGTADLYVYFYERALQLLRDGGVLTFISSNKFFRAGYGEKLRRLLATETHIHQVIDFGDAPVFTAIAYPAIIVVQKGRPAEQRELLALSWQPTNRIDDFRTLVEQARAAHEQQAPSAPFIMQRSLTADGWRLEGPATQRLLEKLRRTGLPLGDYVKGKFYRGILTGLNEAFVVDRATRDRLIAEHPSSSELLKPWLRGRDVKRWNVAFAEQYIIKIESSENKRHPWSGLSNEQAEEIFAKTYPAVYAWFQPMRNPLIRRSDQGKYYWELRSCGYWQEFERPKILYPDIYEHQSFTFDRQQFYAANTCYFIPLEDPWITGLLNSSAVEWFYSLISNKVRGGYLRAFSDYMRQIPIPSGGSAAGSIEKLVEQILAAKQDSPSADVSAQEQEINERVYALYGLRREEIRLIEESTGGPSPNTGNK